jgi:hypothetical protein
MDAGARSARLRRLLPDGYHRLIKPLIEFRRDRREAVFLFVRLLINPPPIKIDILG